jgi:hypothetical protein
MAGLATFPVQRPMWVHRDVVTAVGPEKVRLAPEKSSALGLEIPVECGTRQRGIDPLK